MIIYLYLVTYFFNSILFFFQTCYQRQRSGLTALQTLRIPNRVQLLHMMIWIHQFLQAFRSHNLTFRRKQTFSNINIGQLTLSYHSFHTLAHQRLCFCLWNRMNINEQLLFVFIDLLIRDWFYTIGVAHLTNVPLGILLSFLHSVDYCHSFCAIRFVDLGLRLLCLYVFDFSIVGL